MATMQAHDTSQATSHTKAAEKFDRSKKTPQANEKSSALENATVPDSPSSAATPVAENPFANQIQTWGRIEPSVQQVLSAMGELITSTPENYKELGHLLKEAQMLISINPHAIQFGDAQGNNAYYSSTTDEIVLGSQHRNVNPYLFAATLAHELQHRFDDRQQQEKFKDRLYTLETERRAFKVGAIMTGSAMDKLKPEDLKQTDLYYFRMVSDRRLAYLQGEASPEFTRMVEESYRQESAAGGFSGGLETASMTRESAQHELQLLQETIARLESEVKIFEECQNKDPNCKIQLAGRKESLKAKTIELNLLQRRLEMAQWEETRGLNLTITSTMLMPATPPAPGTNQ